MNTVELLDQLAEFQAQADYLELKRQELLSTVKVPAEVLAAQDEANKRQQQIDANLWECQRALNEEARIELAELKDPEMPPEFVAALNAVKAKRDEINNRVNREESQERMRCAEAKSKIYNELQAKIADVYRQVEVRKMEINAEFSGQADAVKQNIDDLTKRIKDEVVRDGMSVKGKLFHAVYIRGRVTWNTDMLDGMVIAFPALEKARKVGQPSVTIRKI